ncbi:MAG: hypothetical protein E7392_01485 [Ruminococcaceae bacterium]|nr:hypothetical protein [Oscillospiraceae bacterium]
MFVLLLLIAVACTAVSIFICCSFIKHRFLKYTVQALSMLVVTAYLCMFTIDLTAYIKGGHTVTGHITLSQTKITKSLDYFTVNNTYWGVDGNFKETITITAQTRDSIKFNVTQLDSLIKRNEFIIYYLPVSKFIIKMEVLIPKRNSNIIPYTFYYP